MKTSKGGLVVNVTMGSSLTKKLGVLGDGTLPSSGNRILGVLLEDTDSGDDGPVQVNGEAVILSGAAIVLTAGLAAVQIDAAGKAIPHSSGTKYYVRDAASGADEEVRILLDAE